MGGGKKKIFKHKHLAFQVHCKSLDNLVALYLRSCVVSGCLSASLGQNPNCHYLGYLYDWLSLPRHLHLNLCVLTNFAISGDSEPERDGMT